MITAMKQALEALEQLVPDDLKPYHKEAYNAITALRHAIEQGEAAEPVAWMVYFDSRLGGARITDKLLVWKKEQAEEQVKADLIQSIEPLYTHPPTAPAQPEGTNSNGTPAPAQPTFVKHEVESAEDWSEWVCPDPDEYLIKCCDCGLVHEAQFRVAKYKPLSSEEFTVTDNPNMQAQFRMKRHNIKGASL